MALLDNKTVVSGKDVQKTGFEAFILINFVDWRVSCHRMQRQLTQLCY
jgi:hypothetical protein